MTLDKIVNSADKSKYAALALASAQVANGSLILQSEPNIPLNDNSVYLNMDLTNNDIGAIYDSATLTLLSPLAQALHALPANQLAYPTIQDMIAEWGVGIQPPPSGNVYSGWNRTVNVADGSIDFTHAPFGYTQWLDNTNYPNQSTMALTIQIPLSQLELDGAPGYNPLTDARIELNPNQTVQNAFVGVQDIDNQYSTSGFNYNIVPEPSTMMLLGAGVLAAAVGRKYQKAKEAVTRYVSKKD